MGTIAEKLSKLLNTKSRIRQAIIGQGQDVPENLAFSGYPDKITAIETGVDTSDATATAADVLSGKTFYAGGEKKTGSIITQELATPTISVASNGSITSSITQSTGYVETATKSKTYQLTTQGGKTVTPGTSQQTAVYSGRYTTGNVYVAGSSNLTAGNIRSGVNIFGVTGNYAASASITWYTSNNYGNSLKVSGTTLTGDVHVNFLTQLNAGKTIFFEFDCIDSPTVDSRMAGGYFWLYPDDKNYPVGYVALYHSSGAASFFHQARQAFTVSYSGTTLTLTQKSGYYFWSGHTYFWQVGVIG